jgi:hypothetical protein
VKKGCVNCEHGYLKQGGYWCGDSEEPKPITDIDKHCDSWTEDNLKNILKKCAQAEILRDISKYGRIL